MEEKKLSSEQRKSMDLLYNQLGDFRKEYNSIPESFKDPSTFLENFYQREFDFYRRAVKLRQDFLKVNNPLQSPAINRIVKSLDLVILSFSENLNLLFEHCTSIKINQDNYK